MKEEMIHHSGTYTDQYELAMAQVYFMDGRVNDKAVFDYFFRKLPFGSSYVFFAGLHDLLKVLEELRFNEDDIAFMREQKHDPRFLDYLADFKFNGDVYSCEEGEVVFGFEPFLRVEGSLLEAQIIETLLLNIINFESLIATKASRIRYAARDRTLLEFGLRRAQGPGGYYATRASIFGGFESTSHVKAAKDLGLQPSGTIAHSFVQIETSELLSFQKIR
jgi:nicotinate phosphoribosyltransferase